MKKELVSVVLGLLVCTCLFANHFEAAWQNPYQNPFQAMNIYIYDAVVQGVPLGAGDEIGIFDGDTCVSGKMLTKPCTEYVNVHGAKVGFPMIVSMNGGGVPGSAVTGHFITFKVWVAATNTEYSYPEMAVFFETPYVTTFENRGTSFITMLKYDAPAGKNSQTIASPGRPGAYVENLSFPGTGILLNKMWVESNGGGIMTAYTYNVEALDIRFTGTSPANYSSYGWYIDSGDVDYYVGEDDPITISFDISNSPGITDPSTVDIYKREIHGTGAFTKCTTSYSEPYLTATITSFSEFILGSDSPINTLPVQLSSFTAGMHQGDSVMLQWVTQSETNVSGYRIYRGKEEACASATLLDVFIGATNTSHMQHYVFCDRELVEAGLYYYWLESEDFDGSIQLFGPLSIHFAQAIPSNPSPAAIPGLAAVYPNPFNPSTNIRYDLDKDAWVQIEVYNVRGQKVCSLVAEGLESGYHHLVWDGRDDQGQTQATGVYYVRMLSEGKVYTLKAVLLK